MENVRKSQDNEIIIIIERKTFNLIKKYSREGQLAPDVNQKENTKKKKMSSKILQPSNVAKRRSLLTLFSMINEYSSLGKVTFKDSNM